MRKTKSSPLLTKRELQILKLVADGMTDDEIATTLSISDHTAGVHRSHIFTKLEVRNAAEAVRYAMRRKWIT